MERPRAKGERFTKGTWRASGATAIKEEQFKMVAGATRVELVANLTVPNGELRGFFGWGRCVEGER